MAFLQEVFAATRRRNNIVAPSKGPAEYGDKLQIRKSHASVTVITEAMFRLATKSWQAQGDGCRIAGRGIISPRREP
jgi:hypothetical protein